MLRSIRRPLLALTAAVALIGGCDSGDGPTDPSDPPSGPRVTETFSGTMSVNGSQTFNFISGATRTDCNPQIDTCVTATLTALTPEDAVVGLALGTWNHNNGSCQIVIPNDNAGRGSSVSGATSASGELCVRIYDPGELASSVAFTITVVHP